jgi:catechol 2,3-dioxygenase-like lactoylglutathione lyase family enzyme
VTATAAWAGVIVGDLDASSRWYSDVLPVESTESGQGWIAFNLVGGSCVELHAGDRERPGLVFPSYGTQAGPPVMPGFAVDDVGEAAGGFEVLRVFPDWVVVAAPDGLRVVLTDRECDPGRGLVGFAFASPDPDSLAAFLASLGYGCEVVTGERHEVVLRVASDRECELVDPDGTVVRLTCG